MQVAQGQGADLCRFHHRRGAVGSSRSWGPLCFLSHHLLCPLRCAEGLNADYVKGENLEAVVCEEPQGEYFFVTVPC
jgi:hypothetical protein